jgi:hypothetical protein
MNFGILNKFLEFISKKEIRKMENTAQCWATVRPKIVAQRCSGLPRAAARNGDWASASRPGPEPMWPSHPAHSASRGRVCDVVTVLTPSAAARPVGACR